ncbi:DUF2225 domain-containing protein [Paenisporosarcina cavernae]|uniref:DUF2225 domain-containing protein n=1 Tax=Paenisporosarcina cavernae TaxID=2320858 RepID=A0A385YWS5_9BACL|nr:DUF2225 domain-containing protein [Paenisporosarcina cavernae]AYC29962.1 DUF2225 domain-containing protein [Paenisporosarcina cavernae]
MELSPFYTKQIECLHCKEKFEITKIRSKFVKVDHQETDFQPIYANPEVNPILYNAFVCEHCGFAFTEDFTKYFAPGVKDEIKEKISSKWIPRSLGGERNRTEAITAYKLAILSGTLKHEKHVTLAGLSMRTAWIYRLEEDTEQELRFVTLARNSYEESYSNEDYAGTQMSEVRVLYMIAELSRRIGDREKATRFFSRVIEKQKSTVEPKLIEMAKDRWQEMREEKEKGIVS